MSNFTDVKLGKIQRNIMAIVKDYPEAADNDATLIGLYWMRYDGWDKDRDLLINLDKATRPESITRRRRELHIKGLIKYSEKREKEVQEAFNNERNNIDHSTIPKDGFDCD